MLTFLQCVQTSVYLFSVIGRIVVTRTRPWYSLLSQIWPVSIERLATSFRCRWKSVNGIDCVFGIEVESRMVDLG